MTDDGNLGLDIVGGSDAPPPPAPGRRRAEGKARKPWGRIVVVLVVIGALLTAGWFGVGWVKDQLNGPADYTGQGTGEVVVEIPEGSNGQQMARILHEADVVASAEVFYRLALKDPRFAEIQPGFYTLRSQMSAEWAMRELIDPANRVEGKVTVTEGARLPRIATAIAEATDITKEEVEAAYEKPDEIGLPPEANGNPEGFLYPATYTVAPGTTAEQLLSQMVAQTVAVEKELEIESRAAAIGLSKTEVMTLASILEYEANRDEDYPKVARVFLNRLDQGIALQSDATVAYANGIEGDVWTTEAQRNLDSPYNTYRYQGLPPGPIGSAGKKTIEAVLNPADGSWLYFVPDYENETTVFSDNLRDHQNAANRLAAWCRDASKDVNDIC